jgi:hypothetical protein
MSAVAVVISDGVISDRLPSPSGRGTSFLGSNQWRSIETSAIIRCRNEGNSLCGLGWKRCVRMGKCARYLPACASASALGWPLPWLTSGTSAGPVPLPCACLNTLVLPPATSQRGLSKWHAANSFRNSAMTGIGSWQTRFCGVSQVDSATQGRFSVCLSGSGYSRSEACGDVSCRSDLGAIV